MRFISFSGKSVWGRAGSASSLLNYSIFNANSSSGPARLVGKTQRHLRVSASSNSITMLHRERRGRDKLRQSTAKKQQKGKRRAPATASDEESASEGDERHSDAAMDVDLEGDMALDEDETMEADTLNLFDVHCTGSLLPCLFPEQYHIVNNGLEGQAASISVTNTTT